MFDPYRAASKYNTKIRKITKWYAERLSAITKDRDEQLATADAELTPEIRAVIAAVESAKPNGAALDRVQAPDLEPEIPLPLRVPLPDVAPGSVVVVEDRPAKRR